MQGDVIDLCAGQMTVAAWTNAATVIGAQFYYVTRNGCRGRQLQIRMGDSQCPESGDPTGALTTPPLEASSPPEGQLNHVGWLAEHIGSLLLQPEYSDVTLVVAGARLPAHRLILASCSSYFSSTGVCRDRWKPGFRAGMNELGVVECRNAIRM
ncbi:hypothetical protein HPB47_006288 [Ixodes persulcatus]|uniref:Uncharacterized protein n=1 Tax=Ixodes persulcatus TaxID=34615 RepID=A0AC60PAP2_IXOPE|nr:hypothetical protein HPB47_006288 [Ixodes persulcatus]